jgi:hypothetical protein
MTTHRNIVDFANAFISPGVNSRGGGISTLAQRFLPSARDKYIVHLNKNNKTLHLSAIETPGGKRILVKNIIAQQITRKRGIFKKTFGI